MKKAKTSRKTRKNRFGSFREKENVLGTKTMRKRDSRSRGKILSSTVENSREKLKKE